MTADDTENESGDSVQNDGGGLGSQPSDDRTARAFEAVPYVGKKWTRRYDLPWLLMEWTFARPGVWLRLPPRMKALINRARTRLAMENQLDRMLIAETLEPWETMEVPSGERVEFPAVFVSELYVASHGEALRKKLRSAYWKPEIDPGSPHRDFDSAFRELRDNGRGGWMRIADFVAPESRLVALPGTHREHLPSGFSSISLVLEPIAPTITAVVARFTLSDEAATRLDTTMRAEHRPRILRVNGKPVLQDPRFVGIEKVQAERAALHRSAREWLADRLPGAFADEDERTLPVLDTILTHAYDPVESGGAPGQGNYLRAVGIGDFQGHQILLPELPGFVLENYTPERRSAVERSVWTLAARFDDALTDDAFKYNWKPERTTSGIVHHIELGAGHLLVRLAIGELIENHLRRISHARDLASRIHDGSTPVASVKALRRSILSHGVTVDSFVSEVTRLVEDTSRFEFGVPNLTLRKSPGLVAKSSDLAGSEDTEHLKVLASRIRERAGLLVESEQSLRTLLAVVASLTGTLSSMRSQRWAIVLSVVSLIAAGAAVWIAWATLDALP